MHQHSQVTMSLIDLDLRDTNKLGYGAINKPLCPKPRRLGPSIPEFLKPRCSNHNRQAVNDEGKSIGVLMNLIAADHENKANAEFGCCFSGSPPGRTDNPLVHDVHFMNHQMDIISRRKALSDQFCFNSD